MQLISCETQKDFNLFLFSCSHEGNSLRSDEMWDRLVEMMNSPYDGLPATRNKGIDHGDSIEGITITDRKYDGMTTSGAVHEQIDNAIEQRKHIKKKMITFLGSNHDEMSWRYFGKTQDCISQYICGKLGIPYGTWTARITYKDSRGFDLFKSYHTHGRKSIVSVSDFPERIDSNRKLILKKHLWHKADDCLLMCKAHVHLAIVAEPVKKLAITADDERLYKIYTFDGGDRHKSNLIPRDSRWYCCVPSFVKTQGVGVSGYGERNEYDPTDIGFLIVRIRKGNIVGVDMILD